MTKTAFQLRELCSIGIFAAITCVLAPTPIPLPLTPVPITFGFVAVFSTGLLLRPKCALFAQLCYLLLGMVGLPVFSGFQGGPGVLVGPTGGYLVAYPLTAVLISLLVNRGELAVPVEKRERRYLFGRAALAMLCGAAVSYLFGTIWLSCLSGNTFVQALMLAVVPFLAMDFLKMLLCLLAVLPVRERLIHMRLLV